MAALVVVGLAAAAAAAAAEGQSAPGLQPFLVLFRGDTGSSWFIDTLMNHKEVLIVGYEPVNHLHKTLDGTKPNKPIQGHYLGSQDFQVARMMLLSDILSMPARSELRKFWWTDLVERWHDVVHVSHSADKNKIKATRAIGFKVRPARLDPDQVVSLLKLVGARAIFDTRQDPFLQILARERSNLCGHMQFAATNASDECANGPIDLPVGKMAKAEETVAKWKSEDAYLQQLMDAASIPYTTVTYEDMAADMAVVMERTESFLNVSADIEALDYEHKSEFGLRAKVKSKEHLQPVTSETACELIGNLPELWQALPPHGTIRQAGSSLECLQKHGKPKKPKK